MSAQTGETFLVSPLSALDHHEWSVLWKGYQDFYEADLPQPVWDKTWTSILNGAGPIYGLGLRRHADAPLIGITHFLFHASAWSLTEACYLQDLFVSPKDRGDGAGRVLIEAVKSIALERQCFRLYWTTKQDNAKARILYDKLAVFHGFIRYDMALP